MNEDNINQDPIEPMDDGVMPDDGGGEQHDPIRNLKSEFSRKIENLANQTQNLSARLEQILQNLERQQQQPTVQPRQQDVNIRDLIYEDPEAVVRMIEERATRRASEVVENRVRLSQAAQAAVFEIQAKYPEFAQDGSEAARLAIEKASRLPEHLRGTPEGVKLAMMEVVSELGLVPVSRRKQQTVNSDDFSIPGSSSRSSSTASRRQSDPTKDIDPNTLAFAQLMDPSIVNDPKRLENLKKASQRKNWRTYA